MSYPSQKVSPDITAAVHEHVAGRGGGAARNPDKASREAALDQLQQETATALEERFPDARSDIGKAYESEFDSTGENARSCTTTASCPLEGNDNGAVYLMATAPLLSA